MCFIADDLGYKDLGCRRYNAPDQPRSRIQESVLESQVLTLFDRLRIEPSEIRDWFGQVLRAQREQRRQTDKAQTAEIKRQLATLELQQDRLLNLRLAGEIDAPAFAAKQTEFRDRKARLETQWAEQEQGEQRQNDLAEKVFELSQTLRPKWLTGNIEQKRKMLEIVCLNWTLDGATLVPETRKPFDMLAEGLLVSSGRADRRWTFPNDSAGTRLLWAAIAAKIEFPAELFFAKAAE